jgi:flagellar hook-associated protein 3 FlgL
MVADTVLSDLTQQLSAAQVAVAGARGSTATAVQREARAKELEGLRDAVLRDMNSSFEGTYLFAGTASTTSPYMKGNNGVVSGYQGTGQEMSVDIDMNVEVAVAFNGEAMTKGSDANDVFTEFDRAIVAARAGDSAGLDAANAALQRAMDRITLTQSRVGTSLQFIDDAKVRLGEASRAATAHISSLEDANMAAAVSGMSQADTVYRAALGAAAQLDKPSLMDYLR